MPFWIIKGAVPSPRSLEKSSIGCEGRVRPDQSQVEIVDIFNCYLAAAEFVKASKQLRLSGERERERERERALFHSRTNRVPLTVEIYRGEEGRGGEGRGRGGTPRRAAEQGRA